MVVVLSVSPVVVVVVDVLDPPVTVVVVVVEVLLGGAPPPPLPPLPLCCSDEDIKHISKASNTQKCLFSVSGNLFIFLLRLTRGGGITVGQPVQSSLTNKLTLHINNAKTVFCPVNRQ